MAKAIKATPDLVGEDANIFLRKMLKVERSKVTSKDKEIARKVIEVSNKLVICA